jgi:hypothetical protein
MDSLSESTQQAVNEHLGMAECVERSVAGIGCTIALTERYLILIRDGAAFRRRTGVRSWPLNADLAVRLTPVRHGAQRLLINGCAAPTSVFLAGVHVNEARKLAAEVQRRCALASRLVPPA